MPMYSFVKVPVFALPSVGSVCQARCTTSSNRRFILRPSRLPVIPCVAQVEDPSVHSRQDDLSTSSSDDGNTSSKHSSPPEIALDTKNSTLKYSDHSEHISKYSSGSGGSGGSGDGSGSAKGGGGDDNHADDHPSGPNAILTAFAGASNVVHTTVKSAKGILTAFSAALSSWVTLLLNTVPAPVIVALISLASTLWGARFRALRDARDARKARADAARKRKTEIERELRKNYEQLAAPLLKSAAKLAERLQFLVTTDWSAVELSDGSDSKLSPMYSAYLLGRFLAHVEILKKESALLDFGFPTADRILANIIGRTQGVLCANDDTLNAIQRNEHFFKPPPGEKPLRAGPLKISPRKQTVLGELLFRKNWSNVYHLPPVEKDALEHGPKAVLTYLEFSHVLKKDETMQRWYKDIVSQFRDLERFVYATPVNKRRSDKLGARIYVLQSTLVDVIEFFDPHPHPQSIPTHHRERLQLGIQSYKEEVRSPLSLRKLYAELAEFRDHREHADGRAARLALPYVIELFMTGKYDAGDPRIAISEHGNCPFSHRVLIALREMGIPYRTVSISPDNRPAWFYLLNPLSQTPVIYHNGNVIADSANIVAYLTEKFPNANHLASADHLKLAVGSSAFTRFHSHFVKWVCGNEEEKQRMEEELRKLEITLRQAQAQNGGAPFLGGSRFSREDTAIAPCLHVVEVAGRRMKGWTLPRELQATQKYLDEARLMPSFRDTGAKEEAVVSRLKACATRPSASARLSDMLE